MIVVAGFFGHVRYPLFKMKGGGVVTFPVALLAILVSVIAGWAGACRHTGEAVEVFGYETCQGTNATLARDAAATYAFQPGILSGVGVGLSEWSALSDYIATV